MIETKRLNIYPASQEQIFDFKHYIIQTAFSKANPVHCAHIVFHRRQGFP